MMPDEVRRLPRDKAILLVRGSKPLLLNKTARRNTPIFKSCGTARPPIISPCGVRRKQKQKKRNLVHRRHKVPFRRPTPQKNYRRYPEKKNTVRTPTSWICTRPLTFPAVSTARP